MAITQDGSQAFGISEDFDINLSQYLIAESVSFTGTSSRVDLNNGDGEPIGATTVPQREDFSATLQVGASVSLVPEIGNIYIIHGKEVILTEVALAETQSDYRRYNISGYSRTNDAHIVYLRTANVAGSKEAYTPSTSSSAVSDSSAFNVSKAFQTSKAVATYFLEPYGFFDVGSATQTVTIPITTSGSAFNSGNSSASSGVSLVTASCSTTLIKFTVAPTATQVRITYSIDT